MSPSCIEVEHIADVESLPPDDPVRRHIDQCPRCRSLWLSYQTFMAATPVDGSRPDAARAELAAFVRGRLAGTTPARSSRFPFRSLLTGWHPVPAMAAAAIVLIAAVVLFRSGRETDAPILRGHANEATLSTRETTLLQSGAVRFAWSAVPDADGYEVRVYGPDLLEVARRSATGTSLEIEAGVLPSGELTWRVVALRAGDEIETSAPASLAIP